MPRPHEPYPAEYRRRIVELARAGRSVADLAREFEPSVNTIRNWVRQTDRDEGRREDGLTTEERSEIRRLRRQVKQLELEREILKKAGGLVRAGDRLDPVRAFEFVRAHQAVYPIVTMCRVLEVSTSGYYAWCQRRASARKLRDAVLKARIREIHKKSRQTYGAPRVHAELKAQKVAVAKKRVARLMRQAGLKGVSRRKGVVTTRRDEAARPAPDLVERDFTAAGPDRLWVADITYVPTWAGFLYLAIVLDVWSRRVIGWAMATHLRTELVLEALEMAIERRRPEGGVIHHSDQGSQYTALAFGQRCEEAGVRPSMGSVGDAYDNALCESFFATLECELLDRSTFRTPREARREVFDYIEGWYNPHRLHSSLGYESPVNYERRWLAPV
ncbi:MAG: IS3 family transposase [Candidatus Rokuibacteriota bacterium]